MTLLPLLNASLVVQLHVLAALPAILLGPIVIWGRNSRRKHKILGYIWVVSVAFLATSGLFIPSHGLAMIWHFGPIHALSIFTLWGLAEGIWQARRGHIKKHAAGMRSTWGGAMGIAGLLTLMPGRTINQMVFGGPSQLGWVLISVGAVGLLLLHRSRARPFAKPQTREAG